MSVSYTRRVLGAGAVLLLTGCGGNTLGALGDILGQAAGGTTGAANSEPQRVSAEVRGVNTQQQTIEIATQNGQTGNVRYDGNTVVVYQNQQYQVSALERGDVGVFTLQQSQNVTYVSRVEVQQSAQDRSGSSTTGNIVQLTGRVANMNQNNGTFVLQTQNGNVTLQLPNNPPQATLNYFRSLRNGNSIRLEVTPIATGRAEIYRFL